MLLTGCYNLHQGHYVAAKAVGWSQQTEAGSYFYHYPTKQSPGFIWYVQIGGREKGKLHLRIGSEGYFPWSSKLIWDPNTLSFFGKPIRIKFAEQNQEVSVPADGFQSIHGQDLEIGDPQNFTVIVPAFKIGENLIPELSAQIHWSDEKYREWVPLQ